MVLNELIYLGNEEQVNVTKRVEGQNSVMCDLVQGKVKIVMSKLR